MAAPFSFGMPGIDWRVHCVQLATAVEALLEEAPAGTETNTLARMMLDEYRTAVMRGNVAERGDNVIPIRRPVSLDTIIDDVAGPQT